LRTARVDHSGVPGPARPIRPADRHRAAPLAGRAGSPRIASRREATTDPAVVAWHEAGHAVLARAVAIDVGSVRAGVRHAGVTIVQLRSGTLCRRQA
jgi:hypothetical protein